MLLNVLWGAGARVIAVGETDRGLFDLGVLRHFLHIQGDIIANSTVNLTMTQPTATMKDLLQEFVD